jgi:hypothetical protein
MLFNLCCLRLFLSHVMKVHFPNTDRPALNGNKIYSVSSIVKSIGETDIFSNTGPHTVLYVLSNLNMGTISGKTHIR